MPLFLGLDCGGTSTRSMIVDDAGLVVFQGMGGPANLASTEADTIKASLRQALRGAPAVDAACGCFAGLLGDAASKRGGALLGELLPKTAKTIYPDYVAALAAAPADTDAVVVSGTGSVVCSWKDGIPVKSGGGGHILGDLGSAFDVGRNAVRWISVPLGGGVEKASPELQHALFERFGTRDPEELPYSIGRAEGVATKLASLAPIVGADLVAKYQYADFAVLQALTGLCWIVRNHVQALVTEKPPVRLVLAGGLWDAHPVFMEQFKRLMASHKVSNDPKTWKRRQYHVERLADPPVMGAALLAKRLFDGN
ncbi:MAG: hypothetical protein JSS66_00400 [Armatimonadetes bacterium]|nr:hypothetical protein [Armatimonadota bacterium]